MTCTFSIMCTPRHFVDRCLMFIATIIIFLQAILVGCAESGTPFQISCSPKRQEISFPVISDVTGRVTSLSALSSQTTTPDYLSVTLKWRRKPQNVILFKNEVTSPRTYTEWEDGNVTYVRMKEKMCHYQGYVRGQGSSDAAISTCNGLTGYIQTDEELLFIQPATTNVTNGAHVVYTCERRQRIPEPQWEHTAYHNRRQRRAASAPKYLEVMVAIDSTLVRDIGTKEKTEDYVMTLFNIANIVYQHHSLGVDVRVVVVKIIFVEKNQQRQVLTRRDAFRTVNKFCEWSQRQIPPGKPMDYDISVLITKEELGPSGYAPITGLCNPIRSCAAVRDEGFTTGFIIAHEMAHVFGLFHDGHGNHCHGRKYSSAMMAALVESKLNHFWWSECSSNRMKEMVRYLFCLNNVPELPAGHYPLKATKEIEPELGRSWTLDFQCQMEFGSHYRLCRAFYNDPCSTLWCSRAPNYYLCRTKRGPPIAGSPCGRDRECRDERCQYVGNRRPVNGNWGGWGRWSDCSTDCGVGIRQRTRVCDNPKPAYDGKDCEGETSKWDTCLNKTCATYEDVRAGECQVWDTLQIRYGTHDWQPYEGQNASSLCKQTCRSFYTQDIVTIDVDVSDGTPCSYTGNNSNICMGGQCLTVGCDGKINSTKKEDMCGICGGDGSECKRVSGTYRRTPKQGDKYLTVLTLPTGARDILVNETKSSVQFLAIQDPRYGTFSLNGDKKQSRDKQLVISGAMFKYIKGGSTINESITSPGPIRRELIVMLYPNRKLEEATIHWSYTVHKSDFTLEMTKYKWKFEKWSQCSVTCGQGIQNIIHGCYDKDSNEKVDDKKCEHIKAPRKDEVVCKRNKCGVMRYNFAMSNDYGDCDAECGGSGIQVQKFFCERMFTNNNTYERASMNFCEHLQKPHVTRLCKGEPCQPVEMFKWKALDTWSECPCGTGNVQTREVVCVKVLSTPPTEESGQDESGEEEDEDVVVEAVEPQLCQDAEDKPEASQPCQGKPCKPFFRWAESDKLTACDAPCDGDGWQMPVLVCEFVTIVHDLEAVERADDYLCDEVTKPDTEPQECTGEPCQEESVIYEWHGLDQWSECDATCDDFGSQSRQYVCQTVKSDGSRSNVSDIECDDSPKPSETRDCDGKPCPLKWSIGDWGECSVTCGEGRSYRKVYCGDPLTDLDDIRCTDDPPPLSKPCVKKDCPAIKYEDCEDMYSFCTTYKDLKTRCNRRNFRRKCCKTCLNAKGSASRPLSALERYMKKRGLGRWARRRR